MAIIAAITYGVAGISLLGILAPVVLLWRKSLRFAPGTWGHRLAAVYSSVVTLCAAVIVWMMANWVRQLLDPALTGHPGPLALVMFPYAASWVGIPAGLGIGVMHSILERRKRIGKQV